MKRIVLLTIFLPLLLIVGCKETENQKVEVSINPDKATLLINHSQVFNAIAKYAEDLETTTTPPDPFLVSWTTSCGTIRHLEKNKIEYTAPSEIGECTLKAEVIGGYSNSVNIVVQSNSEVCSNPPIKDENLEILIKKKLGIARKVNCSDLANLEELIQATNSKRPKSDQIKELEGLQFATKLKTLKLPNNQISDIYNIASLKNLKVLSIYNNELKGINAVRSLKHLTKLFLGVNNIESLEPISELRELEELYIFSNKITFISSLEGLLNLRIAQLNNNNIFDISALIDNRNFSGSDHRLSVAKNCLDLRPDSQDSKNINELNSREVKVVYEPQLRCR